MKVTLIWYPVKLHYKTNHSVHMKETLIVNWLIVPLNSFQKVIFLEH